MIKHKVWPRLLPFVQPQRLFAACMVIGGKAGFNSNNSSTTTTTMNSNTTYQSKSILLPKQSTKQSKIINNYSSSSSSSSSSSNSSSRVFKDDYLNESFYQFSSQGPAFAVNPNNIEFIQEPNDFYNHLISGIKRSKKRITFASLYLGIGEKESLIVTSMIEACERNPNLKIHILLDGLRGSRDVPTPSTSTSTTTLQSSVTMLQPLLNQFSDRVQISMYHTPDLNGLLKRFLPPRVNETIGVNHLKTYVFDDDLVMSGANLSKDYFTNRQDRYVVIKQSQALASFFDTIVETVGSMSLVMTPNATGPSIGRLHLPNDGRLDPVTQSKDFKEVAEKKLSAILQPDTFYLASSDGLKSFSSPSDVRASSSSSSSRHTWIFPTIQMGPFNIRHDEVCTSYIFNTVPRESLFYITSPYFNLTKNYLQLIMQGRPKLDIITCSPEANGFFGAKGLSSAVPDCYAIIEKRFLDLVKRTGNEQRIKVEEYIRNGWTYHAKGLWITSQDQTSVPSITLIGSPNFGSRSVEKDLEAQMIIMTEDVELQQKMEGERAYLWESTQVADDKLFEERKISLWVQCIVYLFGGYLIDVHIRFNSPTNAQRA
ncbi:phosphatidylglycerophosphate synthase 1 [Cavenderia fasciculata]|uniref:CDP-diacylglycerol--glycerol-3-phosphate 3-phosphatidyltransferase n=1 Tax=Cavenderia fasciculata TaxID=261658 RepID=F4Q4Q5_CACFS|nr:phosphatidylglycerophosphate synthase 1 [Cavenderia fasciculata]EGG17064.1 phosphatidylglycerophosphate synthase 1 [Cavenderia fasciculata]|eukprot:XP_004355548.1 phosphatidylglycerophosphate synthase 1 [Cavenderia fasciculata]